MGQESQSPSSVFSIDVSAGGNKELLPRKEGEDGRVADLLQQLVVGQERQNELLEEMVDNMNSNQRQRSAELGQWKQSNPQLSDRCRKAAEVLSNVQTEFLESLTNEIQFNSDSLLDGDFMLNEFVDRFGPRLAHLNGVLQVLSQLSSAPGGFSDRE